MNCENFLCIYQNKGACTLKNIELDIQGQCKECIYINIDEKDLESLKFKTRISLDL